MEFIVIFFTCVGLFVLFGFLDLHIRRSSGKLLLKISEKERGGKFTVQEDYKLIEVWLDTLVRGKGLQVIRGNIELSIQGPVNKTVVLEEDNRGGHPGTVNLLSRNTQRKSLDSLPAGTYHLYVNSNDSLQIISLEIRGYSKKYWLSFLVK